MTQSMRPRARLVHTLGSELISNERIAIIELVKNAYDADASQVVIRFRGPLCAGAGAIEVWDNGHGMDPVTVRSAWLDIATTNRKRAPLSQSLRRRVLGEKGIGRLAASRVGHVTTLTTKSEGADEVQVRVDWDQFENDDLYLDEVEIEVRVDETEVFESTRIASVLGATNHGTIVRMEALKKTWDLSEIEELRLSLARLVPPPTAPELKSHAEDKFSISLSLPPSFSGLDGEVGAIAAFDYPHYRIWGSIGSDGQASLHFTNLLEASGEKSLEMALRVPTREDPKETRLPNIGPLFVDFRAWDLDRDAYSELSELVDLGVENLPDFRRVIRSESGISLYRDGFRVHPFGDSTFDWLGLDARRVNNPTTRLSNNQIRGFIAITADGNPGLRDRSHREGLIDSESYEDLVQIATQVLSELETRRRLWRAAAQRSSPEREKARGLFDAFDLSALREFASDHADAPELAALIDEATESVDAGVRSVKETLSRYSRLATLGRLIDVVLHDGRGALNRVQLALDSLEKAAVDELHSPGSVELASQRVIPRMASGTALLRALFSRIEPLSGRKKGRPTASSLSTLIKASVDLLASDIERMKIEVELDVEPVRVVVDKAEVIQVLVNLLDNATYWLGRVDPQTRRVRIEAKATSEGGFEIVVSDSGPGISEDIRSHIFDAYFSTKSNGTGLGLAIVGSVVHDLYGGSLELMEPNELGGAAFRVTFNERTGS